MKEKFSLGFFPTPLHVLNGLNRLFPDYQFMIKRDDHTGLATGGNKTRKLEYFIGEALQKGCDCVITAGSQQSNHCRQTAAACAMADLDCHLLLGGEQPSEYNGNLLLSKLLGANLHFSKDKRKGEDIPILMDQLLKNGKKPYVIPYGGSTFLGARGYVNAVKELKEQLSNMSIHPDYLFFATSSGGTQAGLILGKLLHHFNCQLMPVHIDKNLPGEPDLKTLVAAMVFEGIRFYNLDTQIPPPDFNILEDYNQAGYGIVTKQEKAAIELLAKSDGILLDPVYTGRAFAALLDHVQNKKLPIGSTILFWHTGGIPATFAYANELRLFESTL